MSLSFEPAALRALAELIEKTGLTEIELAEGDRKLRLVRTPAAVTVPVMTAPAPAAPQPAAAAPEVKTDPASHPGLVKSPMVGVAYLSAEPGAAPYVSVGTQVEAGATLLLIEAMKTFNQIKAPRAGRVTQIFVAAGAPVEYDEPLLIIE
jgi:acetyl-CoA carboxylase biotin carboxyl carrier protein